MNQALQMEIDRYLAQLRAPRVDPWMRQPDERRELPAAYKRVDERMKALRERIADEGMRNIVANLKRGELSAKPLGEVAA